MDRRMELSRLAVLLPEGRKREYMCQAHPGRGLLAVYVQKWGPVASVLLPFGDLRGCGVDAAGVRCPGVVPKEEFGQGRQCLRRTRGLTEKHLDLV